MRLPGGLWDDPEVTEFFDSEPNEFLRPSGKSVDVLVGRTLGGSSCLNAAQWTQPDPQVLGCSSVPSAQVPALRSLHREYFMNLLHLASVCGKRGPLRAFRAAIELDV